MNQQSRTIIFPIRAFILLIGMFFTGSVFTEAAWSQTAGEDESPRYWLDGGLGFSTAGAGPKTSSGGGIAARLAFHMQVERFILSFPYTANTGGKSDHRTLLGNTHDTFNDFSVLIGYPLAETESSLFVVSVGVSRMSGSRVTTEQYVPPCLFGPCEGTATRFTKESLGMRMGVPIEIGLYSLGDSTIGTALVGHININGEEVFAGFTLNLMLGNRSASGNP